MEKITPGLCPFQKTGLQCQILLPSSPNWVCELHHSAGLKANLMLIQETCEFAQLNQDQAKMIKQQDYVLVGRLY